MHVSAAVTYPRTPSWDAERGAHMGLPVHSYWNSAGWRFGCRVGQVLDRPADGGWLVFAGGPAAALAASHLRSPRTFTVQLDHLLSSVRKVNHSRPENRAHFLVDLVR